MTKFQILEKLKTLVPYFLVGLALIIAFRISGSLGVFGDFVAATWAIISPFFYGFLLAYIINIPCGAVQKLYARSKNKFIQRKQRMLSILTTMLLGAGLLTLALILIIPQVVNSITTFINDWEANWARVLAVVESFNNLGLFTIDLDEIGNALGGFFLNLTAEEWMQFLTNIMGVGTTVFGGLITIISSIYILAEKDRIKALAAKLLGIFAPKNFSESAMAAGRRLSRYFRLYIRTQTIDGFILGTIATIALWIMGSPHALVLGIMLGILNYIPIFGSLFGTIIAVIVVIFTQDFTAGLIAAAVLFVIQQIDANIIQPRLMGESFSFSPLLVIISITVGSALAGVLGMIMAIPMAAILKDVFDEIVEYYSRKKFGKQSK
ncbi:MAG: AI-2E family transporter [Defluviitaleaceae bacterium]|nr:AI-2E family transporter [Defluviitaleaceae bacterium]